MEGTFDKACTETCPLTTYYCCLVLSLKGSKFFNKKKRKKTRMLKQIAGLKKHLNSSLSDRHSALTFCPGPLLAHLS